MSLLTPANAEDAFVERVSDVSTLPTVAVHIFETVQDPGSSARDLMEVVSSDPALTTRVLRTVNSAAFGLSTRVTNVQSAISFLGFTQVRNLALTASVSRIFQGGERIGRYDRQGLWRHMVSVALGARLIARRTGLLDFEDAFLAGLLHDIGIILEDEHVHAEFVQIVAALEEGDDLLSREREILGFDHTVIGRRIAAHWKFPGLLLDAIGSHHDSERVTGPSAPFIRCVEAANVLCTLKNITSIGVRCVLPKPAVFRELGICPTGVRILAEDLDGAFEQHECLFEML